MEFLFSTPAMSAAFSPSRQLRAMAEFEWALACALERAGLADPGSGDVLKRHLDAKFVDQKALQEGAGSAGNIAIPFIRQLTACVKMDYEAMARTIHLGATSQDVLDTALVLQIREALVLILEAIDRLDGALARQTRAHAQIILTGRTWLQPAPPTTLGLKLAGTLSALRRHRTRITEAAKRGIVLQFGGAVGTLAALGSDGPAVSAELARILDLREPEAPWHTQRDSLVELAAVMALLTGTLGKFARDISLLMQAEVGEAAEPAGEDKGGSSTMPQKQNPVGCAAILACAARIPGLLATLLGAMAQEHERGLGLWQAESATLPAVFQLAAAALERSIEIADNLVADAGRMMDNLNARLGLNQAEAVSVALAREMGRETAHELLQRACRQAAETGVHLAAVLKTMPDVTGHLRTEEIDRLLDPRQYLGSAQRYIGRVLGDVDASR